jgi:hypothetical protein
LLKILNIHKKKNNLFFHLYKKNEIYNISLKKLRNIKIVKKLEKKLLFDKIFVSSYEYNFKIQEFFKNRNIYSIYDNSSRSILDYLFIKKFNDKIKIHSISIFDEK